MSVAQFGIKLIELKDTMDKYCVVTGASKGIGLAIASSLMKKNWSVALCSRTPLSDFNRETQELIATTNSAVFYLDLMDAESIKNLPLLLLKWCNGVLHGLINNAGIAHGV